MVHSGAACATWQRLLTSSDHSVRKSNLGILYSSFAYCIRTIHNHKITVIKEVEKGLKKKSEIAKDFGILPNTFSTVLKKKDKILNTGNSIRKDRKRTRGPENSEVDECVLKWFKHARDQKIPVMTLGKNYFKASHGWLDGFKSRNQIVFKSVCGESGDVDVQAANEWKTDLLEIIGDRDPKTFLMCTPDKTMSCSGCKLSKDRVTLLVGANMDGSKKLPLLIIGKSANPRCFQNVKFKTVEYKSNRKAWMTCELFEKWLVKLDKKMSKQKWEVLLFIDNCMAHKSIPVLENVKVMFFLVNMTSIVQSMDQGVIKHFYRWLVVENILTTNEDKKLKIDLHQASQMCNHAWEKVKIVSRKQDLHSEEMRMISEIKIK
ncbi:hypothetical protein PR048_009306 [Dryococelus australis]|uniref:Tigger transposable element-derived protein 6 n=1 Tax=Dryococelus australis TaxID=614101 RepID=A0ABQ9HZI3_9NEOP|nr:hypothetical protein PR048_009306 [Dryococelus australis]